MLFNDSSIHVNSAEFDMLRQPILRGLLTVVFITVILAGFIGNTTIVCSVFRNRKMWNVTNLFITTLALSDIGLCIFSLPLQLYYQLTDHWIFGKSLCQVIFPAFIMPMYVSNFTILMIAFERYRLILYPLARQLTKLRALLAVAIIVVCTLLFCIPVFTFTTLYEINQTDIQLYRHYCIEAWPSVTGRKIYSTISFMVQFCLPLCLTSMLYYKIVCRLSKRTNHRMSSNDQRRHKTNRILIAIVCLFVICWLPWNLFSLLAELNHGLVKGSHFKFVDLLLKVFAMSSSCVNPFLYCWLNDNFRRELDGIGLKLRVCNQSQATRMQLHQPVSHHKNILPSANMNRMLGYPVNNQSTSSLDCMVRNKLPRQGSDCPPIGGETANATDIYTLKKQCTVDSCTPSNATSMASLGDIVNAHDVQSRKSL